MPHPSTSRRRDLCVTMDIRHGDSGADFGVRGVLHVHPGTGEEGQEILLASIIAIIHV